MCTNSGRRLCVIYRVVDMLFHFEPAAMCHLQQTGLAISPLPAKKQLWEASDEFCWKTEAEREPGTQPAFALAVSGELVKLDQGQMPDSGTTHLQAALDTASPRRSTANWDEWCSDMDGFGGLVMLAASFTATL